MNRFTTKVDLLHDSVYIKELKVKHFKILLKTLLGDDPDLEEVLTNLIHVLVQTTPYTKKTLYNISIIDFLLLVLHLRCISIGSDIHLELVGETNTKIILNLDRVIETIKKSFTQNYTQTIENLKIEYQPLSVKDFLYPKKTNNDLLLLKSFINKIYFDENNILPVFEIDDNTFLKVFKALPANYSSQILKHIKQISQQLYQTNLLQHFSDKNLSLYINQTNFVFILQLLFSKNLMPLYENIFALAKFANMSPEYVEECTPGEYTIYVKLLERILKEQNSQAQSSVSLPPINPDNPNFM
jgi:hypothetical protein